MPASFMKLVVHPAEDSCKIKEGLPSLIRTFFRNKNKPLLIINLIKMYFNCCEV